MPKQTVKFGDVWTNRASFTLVATEQAECQPWTWGRTACVGDSTPNAGAGGNAGIGSAAALANAIEAMLDNSGPNPLLQAIKDCVRRHQRSRDERTASVIRSRQQVHTHTRKERIRRRIAAYYVIPNAGDNRTDMHSDVMVGAVMLDYLPPPPRSRSRLHCLSTLHKALGRRVSDYRHRRRCHSSVSSRCP